MRLRVAGMRKHNRLKPFIHRDKWDAWDKCEAKKRIPTAKTFQSSGFGFIPLIPFIPV
jgi:hypothetical protein